MHRQADVKLMCVLDYHLCFRYCADSCTSKQMCVGMSTPQRKQVQFMEVRIDRASVWESGTRVRVGMAYGQGGMCLFGRLSVHHTS